AASDPKFDPFAKSPLAGDPEFGRVRTFLEKDRCNFRDDVRRGQAFRARLPEIADCAALFLREPRSLLFRYWFRDDSEAPGGDGYRLLMVDWGGGNWVMSTDPRKRISLQVLCERLQAVEPPAANGASGQWFDGRPFYHTLIAAPRGGTKLAEADLLKVVKGWAALRPAKPQASANHQNPNPEGWRRYAQWVAVPVIGAVTNFALSKYGGSNKADAGPPPPSQPVVVSPQIIPRPQIDEESRNRGNSSVREKTLSIAANGDGEYSFAVPDDMRQQSPLSLRIVLRDWPADLPELTANADGVDYKLQWDTERAYGAERWSKELPLDPLPGDPVKIKLHNPTRAPIRFTSIQADWHTDERTLYVLS